MAPPLLVLVMIMSVRLHNSLKAIFSPLDKLLYPLLPLISPCCFSSVSVAYIYFLMVSWFS